MVRGEEVHVPSHSGTQPVGAPQQLPQQGHWIDSAYQQGRGPAVIEGHTVPLDQLRHHPGGDSLLASSQMHLSRDVAVLPELFNSKLEEATAQHLSVQCP